MKNAILIIATTIFLYACNNTETNEPIAPTAATKTIAKINYNIIGAYKHDTASFTEGLEFYKGKLYESGGDYGTSQLQFGDARTGKIEAKNKMNAPTMFAEGITILNGKLYQLTYQTNEVFVYNVDNINKVIQKFTWPLEGWGMTNNGTDLLITTGGTDLFFVNPATFKVKKTVHIHDGTGPVASVNELEYVDGFVWANIYQTNDIVKIDPETGEIVGKMNFDNLLQPADIVPNRTFEFNGIAYDSAAKTFFITGKRWPKIFELKIN